LGPPSLESSWQAEDISNLVYGTTSYSFSAVRSFVPVLGLKNIGHLASCLGCWRSRPLRQSSPKWEKLIPDSSRISTQSFMPLSFFRRWEICNHTNKQTNTQ